MTRTIQIVCTDDEYAELLKRKIAAEMTWKSALFYTFRIDNEDEARARERKPGPQPKHALDGIYEEARKKALENMGEDADTFDKVPLDKIFEYEHKKRLKRM